MTRSGSGTCARSTARTRQVRSRRRTRQTLPSRTCGGPRRNERAAHCTRVARAAQAGASGCGRVRADRWTRRAAHLVLAKHGLEREHRLRATILCAAATRTH
eukprot:1155828-Prymnesium_polylepis.1